jgi:hypothetical protein
MCRFLSGNVRWRIEDISLFYSVSRTIISRVGVSRKTSSVSAKAQPVSAFTRCVQHQPGTARNRVSCFDMIGHGRTYSYGMHTRARFLCTLVRNNVDNHSAMCALDFDGWMTLGKVTCLPSEYVRGQDSRCAFRE